MSQFCSKCGEKFNKTDSFCAGCGNKRNTKKHNKLETNNTELFSVTHRPTLTVLFFQIIFFFIYPFIYLNDILSKLDIKSKFTLFNYRIWHLALFSIIIGIYFRYIAVLIYEYPNENDVIFVLSNILIFLPYIFWCLFYLIFYIIALVKSVNKINKLLPRQERINRFWSLIFGVFYIQYKINNLGEVNKKEPKKTNEKYKYRKVLAISLCGILILSTIPKCQRLFSHTDAIYGSYGTDAVYAGMDFQGKYYLLSSNPVRTTMDEVAKICENNPDTDLSLGCNVQTGDKFKIYISKVNENSLKGIEIYSIAHEMLHTAYAKLPQTEKQEIDKALLEIYPKILASNDTIAKNALEPYKGLEQSSLINEIHSIAPIYNADLGTILEKHYKNIFKDRQTLAKNYKSSEQVLIDAEANLKSWETALKQYDDWTTKNFPTLEKQKNDLSYFAYSGNYYAYNNLVPVYNKNIDLYNTVYSTYENNFKGYETSYKQYKSLYTSLERNMTYQDAELATSKVYDKAK